MDEVLNDDIRNFGELEVRVRFVVSQELPVRESSTTGIGVIFDDGALLLTKNRRYGWSLPGGHIEPDETPEAAMRREVLEEAGAVVGPARFFGSQELRVLNEPIPESYEYPVPSYQCFFVGLTESFHFTSNDECEEAGFFRPGSDVFEEWITKEETRSLVQRAAAIAADLRAD